MTNQKPQRLLGPDGSLLGARKAPKYRKSENPIKEQYVDHEHGHTVVYTQNCDDVIKGVHEARHVHPKHARNGNTEYLGSAPLLVCQIWAKESGTRIGTREFSEYARQRLMSADYSRFKAWLQ